MGFLDNAKKEIINNPINTGLNAYSAKKLHDLTRQQEENKNLLEEQNKLLSEQNHILSLSPKQKKII